MRQVQLPSHTTDARALCFFTSATFLHFLTQHPSRYASMDTVNHIKLVSRGRRGRVWMASRSLTV